MVESAKTTRFGLPLESHSHAPLQQNFPAAMQTLDEKAAKSDPTGITGAVQISNIVKMTQAAYDALDPKDSATLYIIVG